MTAQDIKSVCVILGKDIFVVQLRWSWRSDQPLPILSQEL